MLGILVDLCLLELYLSRIVCKDTVLSNFCVGFSTLINIQ